MSDPSGLDDLEAELARMEAELAALQGKSAPEKPRKKEKKERKPLFARKKEEAPPAEAEAAPAASEVHAVPAPPERVAVVASPLPAPMAPALVDTMPASAPHVEQPDFLPPSGRWRQEGRAWVLAADAEPAVVRRILDADGRVVAEEPATREALGDAPEPDAPGGAQAPERPLHALAGILGGRKERKKGLFGFRKRDG